MTPETCDLWDIWSVLKKRDLSHLTNILTNIFVENFDNFQLFLRILTILTIFDNFDFFWQFSKMLKFFANVDNSKDNPGDLWYLRQWLQFWQLITWIHDNLCCLTIIKEQHWTAFAILAMFYLNPTFCIPTCMFPWSWTESPDMTQQPLWKQARKSSEDAQVAGYAQFEKVWAG